MVLLRESKNSKGRTWTACTSSCSSCYKQDLSKNTNEKDEKNQKYVQRKLHGVSLCNGMGQQENAPCSWALLLSASIGDRMINLK